MGWVYGKAKLETAERDDVEQRIIWLGKKAKIIEPLQKSYHYFYDYLLSVKEFLLAARALLDWRRNKTDWTTMALLRLTYWQR